MDRNYINPADLHGDPVNTFEFFDFGASSGEFTFCEDVVNPAALPDLAAVDSAVDLTAFNNNNDGWMSPSPTAIHIPHQPSADQPQPKVQVIPDKTKTRAETQIKVNLVLDPVDDRVEYIHFPRNTLAKPKLLATPDEVNSIMGSGAAVYLDLMLICATALDQPGGEAKALQYARGETMQPRKPPGVALSDLDKEDETHPQNGGAVLICDGCKERERKRYDRKKKRADDETEWTSYENERVIMINEKEFKKWKAIDQYGDLSPKAKQVEFAMRIACYCRHQEEKSPVGYKVIFTFKDAHKNVLVQHISDIFQITDDHKNKEVAPDTLPRPLSMPQFATNVHTQMYPTQPYQYNQAGMASYPTPPTPVAGKVATYANTMSSNIPQMEFQQNVAHPGAPPLTIPGSNYPIEYPSYYNFSAPPSVPSTPISLSRPASPTWEQGPQKRKVRCVYFYVGDE